MPKSRLRDWIIDCSIEPLLIEYMRSEKSMFGKVRMGFLPIWDNILVTECPGITIMEVSELAVTIVLADDHPMTRAGLVFWFSQREEFHLLGEAGNGLEAWEMIQKRLPDVALMDIEMPEESGIAVTRKIREARLRTSVLMLTSYKAQQYVLASLQAGAAGFILKTTPLEELEKAIIGVSQGGFYLDPAIAHLSHLCTPSDKESALSPREREVLTLTARGFSGKDSANRLNISERTVEAHLGAIYSKFGARNKTEAILMALKSGVIRLDELMLDEGDVFL
jgi:DNA-binding NarL/FixJ family response regulator